MASVSSLPMIQVAERTIAQRYWRGSYVCARCLHTRRPLQSEEQSPSTGTSPARTRRERAAKVSEDLADLAKSTEDRPRPASNDPTSDRATESRRESHDSARGAKSASAKKGRTGSANPFESAVYHKATFARPRVASLLRSGQGTATIAGGDYAGVVRDRLRLAMRPGVETSTFSHDAPVRSEAVERFSQEEEYIPSSLDPRERYAQFLGKKFVAGDYGGDRVLHHEADKDHETLDRVEKAVTMNSSYLYQEESRFLQKVKSMMPAAKPKQKQARAA